ncbi:facilitated trehalose transporter Tret1-2 homolog [Zerene cesonia]|uniref:facilitated trehalose transporter Tret1-2 homolog n=1 Tax=Zerene cesonia TaxID=33412 RepID=UPI0018E5616C|nr:facilitated trehalose transporter Tret1-2 homolog [Zerene cesonia]XP_038219108.1 facilitated trehalose transporter Tret1-2 homolog [Zerene cesonia]XP_038219109.1 facilitated trehalose transporter Tret1-2 homolog [Zerene cesonia]
MGEDRHESKEPKAEETQGEEENRSTGTDADTNIPNTDTNTQKQTDNKRNDKEKSNYVQNIMHSGLSLHSNNIKDEMLLPDSKTVARFSPIWKQSLASMAAIFLTFTSGLTSGYSAILLPQLKDSGSSIPTDESTASWIAAMAALPMAPGCLISGWLMEKFGRRNAHFIVSGPFLLGWILIACSNNLALMLLGRFFTGLCVGLLGPLAPVFISETTDPKYRGIFLAGISLAIAVGIFVSHLIGTWVHWQWTALICCIFPVISVILLTMVPESPTWLIAKGEIEDGVKAFGWLRGYSKEAKAELKAILEKKKAEECKPVMSLQQKIISLKSPELLKPLMIMIMFFVTCQFSGVNAIAFYSIEIIEKAVGKGIDHYLAMLVIDTLRTVMSVVACIICKKYGRRPLTMISGIFTALSMVGLSMYLYFTDGKQTNMTWLPLTCLMAYICAISIGLVPIPWMMCGELFPTKVRGLGSGISSATTFVAFFVVVKTAPGMMSNFGEVITFLSYGLIALLGTGVLYFILPETKGKSLQEIEDKFKKPKESIA